MRNFFLTNTCVFALLSAPAIAQTSSGASSQAAPVQSSGTDQSATDSAGLQDIVVTAQRRSERLQDVPIAVAVVTSAQLSRSGASDMVSLRVAVPSLNITNSNGNITTSLRGVGSTSVAPGFENPVAFYVDGVYIASQVAGYLNLNNIAQVEVLKGPQGTLFGRNATGGLVQVLTRTPGRDFEAEGSLSYGNYDRIETKGYVGGPISDTISADLAFSYAQQDDGWGKSRATGIKTFALDHDATIRSKWVFTPSDTTKFTLVGDYSELRDSISNVVIVLPGTISGVAPANGVVPDIGYDTQNNQPNLKDGWAASGSLRWDQRLGSLDFMSLTAYRKSKFFTIFDYDGGSTGFSDVVSYRWPDRQFSQEIQLSSPSGGLFSWVAGAYYFKGTSQYDPVDLTFTNDGAAITILNTQKAKSIAAYGQGTFKLGEETNITGGLRYTHERKQAVDQLQSVFVIPLGITILTTPADQSAKFNKLTYRVSVDHRFSNAVMAYASLNRGFKSGGFSAGAPGSPAYTPEVLDAYEIGLKTDLFDRNLRFNVSGYYYDYKNFQNRDVSLGIPITRNAAAAKLYGIDFDFEARVTSELTFSGGANFGHSTFTKYDNALIGSVIGGTPPTIGSAAGKRLPLSSKVAGNFTANYEKELAGGSTLSLTGSVYYNDGYYFEADNVIEQNGYALLSASALWTDSSGHYSVGLFGRNLTNKRVITFEGTVPNGSHLGVFDAPRTYGVTVGAKF